MATIALFFIFLLFGYSIAPVYFWIHRFLKLKAVPLETKWVHFHHSFYGLILVITGVVELLLLKGVWGGYLVCTGIGLIVHHEMTESHLRGFGKFISRHQHE